MIKIINGSNSRACVIERMQVYFSDLVLGHTGCLKHAECIRAKTRPGFAFYFFSYLTILVVVRSRTRLSCLSRDLSTINFTTSHFNLPFLRWDTVSCFKDIKTISFYYNFYSDSLFTLNSRASIG